MSHMDYDDEEDECNCSDHTSHMENAKKNDKKDKYTFRLENPAFCEDFIDCINDYENPPKFTKLPRNLQRLEEFKIDHNSGDYFCKGGVILELNKYIFDEWYVLSHQGRVARLAEVAYFVNRIDKSNLWILRHFIVEMKQKRKKQGYCSLQDVFEIAVEEFQDDIICAPRFKKILEIFENAKTNPELETTSKAYSKTDVSEITRESYISISIALLSIIFCGGKRMLIFDNKFINQVSVTLAGQEFWRMMHFIIPRFNNYFKIIYGPALVEAGEKIPHAFQYANGEVLAQAIWISTGRQMRITFESFKNILGKEMRESIEKKKIFVNKWFQRDPTTNVTEKEFHTALEKLISGYIMLRIPSILTGNLNIEICRQIGVSFANLSGDSLYLTKSVMESDDQMRNQEEIDKILNKGRKEREEMQKKNESQ